MPYKNLCSYGNGICIFVVVASVGLLLLASGCGRERTQKPTLLRQYPVMGTVAEIKLYGPEDLAIRAADAVYDVFLEVETRCNIFAPGSELSRLNEQAPESPFVCSEMLWAILQDSRRFYEFSDGAFDISSRPLMDIWGFYRKQEKLPGETEINNAKKHVGLHSVIWDDEARSIRFTDPEMRLDLGGIAKGFAVDLAVEKVIDHGINSGTINLGGNVYCLEEPPPGRDSYQIGIRHPVRGNAICGTVSVSASAVSTSGDYEKYCIIEGQRFTHIMDPKSGIPVANVLAVTVVTPRAVDSDALSTAIFVSGEELAAKAVAEIPGTKVLIIKHPPENRQEIKLLKFGSGWDNCHVQNGSNIKMEN